MRTKSARSGYRGLNFSDPFGLKACPEGEVCPEEWAREQGRKALNAIGDFGNALKEGLTEVGKQAALQAGIFAVTGGAGNLEEGAFLIGSKFAVRGGLEGLGLGQKVVSGVRGVLASGRADQVMVEATADGGANVARWVQGKNGVSSAMYHYVIDNGGKVVGAAKQAYDKAGFIAGTFKPY